jgi:hypothetical protein
LSLFAVTPAGVVVGYSVWPWDNLYAPVVGCFVDGVLQATAASNQHRASLVTAPLTLRLRSRIKRRVLFQLGRPIPPLPVADRADLEGPDSPVWFRLDLPPATVDRLRAGDPAVRLERLEDAAVLSSAHTSTSVAAGVAAVESLLNEPESESASRLDGFSAFLTAPLQHQLEVAFVEYLRRLPEKEARDGYLTRLQSGQFSVLDLRGEILRSEEFKARRVGYGARLGASLTMSLWRTLQPIETLLEPHKPLASFAVAEFEGQPVDVFVATAFERMVDRPPKAAEVQRFSDLANSQGRHAVALELSRWGAGRGVFLEVV